MLKFLPGILLIQFVTIGLMLMAFNWSQDIQLIIVIIVIGLISAILVAFWFSSVALNFSIDEQAQIVEKHVQDREKMIKETEKVKTDVMIEKSQLQDQHAREREKILLDAEREKSSVVEESYKKIEKESRKAHSRANLKVGLAFTAALGVSGVMIFSQLITVGVMFLVASGSGLSGYVLRARHDRLSRNKQLSITKE
jgi:Na+-transporting NADH:ubiquinone oxidoreductase subunit NqrC